MHAFESERQPPQVHATLAHDGAGRSPGVTVSPNGSRPARATTRPAAPALPAAEPSEPEYDRAFPQADGEP
jgi:hypothetical protein